MPRNQPNNKVKHKVNNLNIDFTLDNKWTVSFGNLKLFKGNFKQARKFAVNYKFLK